MPQGFCQPLGPQSSEKLVAPVADRGPGASRLHSYIYIYIFRKNALFVKKNYILSKNCFLYFRPPYHSPYHFLSALKNKG